MFYRVENGAVIEAPKKGLKLFIANPTDEQYRLLGYTNKIVEDERPEEKEGFYIEDYHEQIDGVIYKRYKYVEIPEDLHAEVIEDEGI